MLSLFLTQSAIGSLLVLLLVPPREAGRRFFQFTTGQSCVLVTLGLATNLAGGRPALEHRESTLLFAVTAGLLMLSAGLFHLGRLRAGTVSMVISIAPGLTAVAMDTLAFIPQGDASMLSRVVYPLDAFSSGLLTGSVLIAMVLGHYYLNIPGLSIAHLQRLSVVFMAAVGARLALTGISMARSAHALVPLVALLLDTRGRELPAGEMDPYALVFLLVHLVFSCLAPAIMSVMAWRTSLISSTQSATGILYVALVMVIMGELASRYLLTLTGLPL